MNIMIIVIIMIMIIFSGIFCQCEKGTEWLWRSTYGECKVILMKMKNVKAKKL